MECKSVIFFFFKHNVRFDIESNYKVSFCNVNSLDLIYLNILYLINLATKLKIKRGYALLGFSLNNADKAPPNANNIS